MRTTIKLISAIIIAVIFLSNLSYAQTMMGKDSVKTMNNEKMMKDGKMMKDKGDVKVIDLIQHPGTFNKTELILSPGKYRFNITNADVQKEVGFYVHELGNKQSLPNSMPSGTIKKGETKSTGVVELKSGTYEYSCPLNPTPEYKIVVK